MARHFRIALLIESSRGYGRALLRGIASFARQQGNWTFFHEERSLGDHVPKSLKDWRPDGIIARLTSEKIIRQIRLLKVPVVDLYHEDEIKGIPGVTVDQEEVVRMAVEHFIERGFSTFAYCGFANVMFSELRGAHFVDQLSGRGHSVHAFQYPPLSETDDLAAAEAHAMRYSRRLVRWLQELPKPVGLLACNDMRGHQVLASCDEAGVEVPDEVAVLGVDNDDVQCELSGPPLSSIDPNAQMIGHEAARLLQRLLQGKSPLKKKIFIKPTRLVTRRSTDVLAIAERRVAEAVRYVREHACDDMSMAAMAQALKVSRSTLERWFQRVLGRSLNEEIVRVRIDRAAELLLTTHLTVESIAHSTGFLHVESMSRIFKRRRGLAPGQYRLKYQAKGNDGL